MNRFEFAQAVVGADESIVARDNYVRLYDGDEKVSHLGLSFLQLLFLCQLFYARPILARLNLSCFVLGLDSMGSHAKMTCDPMRITNPQSASLYKKNIQNPSFRSVSTMET